MVLARTSDQLQYEFGNNFTDPELLGVAFEKWISKSNKVAY